MNTNPLSPVTDNDIRTFETDGVVCLRNMIDAAWLSELRNGINRVIETPTPLHTIQTLAGEDGFFLSDICMAQWDTAVREFVLQGPAAEIAARLMRSKQCNFWADTLWVKDAATPKRTRWHQDQPFFWVNGEQMCVIWWPLDSVSQADCLELIRGSHQWGKWYAPELSKKGQHLYNNGGREFDRMPDISAQIDDYDVASWAMQPGDCIVFHGSTVHGAPGNTSGHRRRAISTIWMGDDTRLGERPSPGRPHFHGHDLTLGDRMDSGYFPRVWPREGTLDAECFERFNDTELRITN